MSNLIDDVINIKNKYDKLVDSYEKNIGIDNVFNLFKVMNSSFNEKSHGREWRKFREVYRYNFPTINKDANELLNLFDTYYTSFITECLDSLQKLHLGKNIFDMKAEALHIQAWDIALCSINKKVIGGLDDYISNIEMKIYDLFPKYNIDKLKITKYLSNILTVLPKPLISYEDTIKQEYEDFFNEYNCTNKLYFKFTDIYHEKYKHILRASLYNETLFNNQISLINNTNGNYFLQHVSLKNRQENRINKLNELKELLTNKQDLEEFNLLLNIHDALTYLNVNIESQYGFKSIIGLIGIYIIKEQF